jgi:hypothetical protein
VPATAVAVMNSRRETDTAEWDDKSFIGTGCLGN